MDITYPPNRLATVRQPSFKQIKHRSRLKNSIKTENTATKQHKITKFGQKLNPGRKSSTTESNPDVVKSQKSKTSHNSSTSQFSAGAIHLILLVFALLSQPLLAINKTQSSQTGSHRTSITLRDPAYPDTLGLRTSRDDSSSSRATSKTDLNLVKSNSTSHSPVPPAKQNNNQSFSENVAVQNDLQNVVPDKHSTPGSRVPLPIGVADTLLNTELTNTKLINTNIENTKFSNTKLSTTTPSDITSNTKHLDLLGDIINTGTIKTEKTVKQQVPAKVEFNSDSQTPDQVLSGLLNSDEDSNNSDDNETVYVEELIEDTQDSETLVIDDFEDSDYLVEIFQTEAVTDPPVIHTISGDQEISVIETQEAVTASVITTVTEKSAEDSANSQREYTTSLGSKQQQSDQAVGVPPEQEILALLLSAPELSLVKHQRSTPLFTPSNSPLDDENIILEKRRASEQAAPTSNNIEDISSSSLPVATLTSRPAAHIQKSLGKLKNTEKKQEKSKQESFAVGASREQSLSATSSSSNSVSPSSSSSLLFFSSTDSSIERAAKNALESSEYRVSKGNRNISEATVENTDKKHQAGNSNSEKQSNFENHNFKSQLPVKQSNHPGTLVHDKMTPRLKNTHNIQNPENETKNADKSNRVKSPTLQTTHNNEAAENSVDDSKTRNTIRDSRTHQNTPKNTKNIKSSSKKLSKSQKVSNPRIIDFNITTNTTPISTTPDTPIKMRISDSSRPESHQNITDPNLQLSPTSQNLLSINIDKQTLNIVLISVISGVVVGAILTSLLCYCCCRCVKKRRKNKSFTRKREKSVKTEGLGIHGDCQQWTKPPPGILQPAKLTRRSNYTEQTYEHLDFSLEGNENKRLLSGSGSGSNTASSSAGVVHHHHNHSQLGERNSNTSFIKPINTYPPLPELQDNTASSIITDILPQKSSTLKYDINGTIMPPRNKSAASTLSTGYSSQHTSLVQRKSSSKDNNNHHPRRDSDNMSGSTSQKLSASSQIDKLTSPNRKVQTLPAQPVTSGSFRSQARSPLSHKTSDTNSLHQNRQQQFVTQSTKAIPTLATQIVNL